MLKSLKTGKAKDPFDMPNEIFRPDVAGSDLILAITKLMNRIKDELNFPEPINVCNVTNLFKNKGLKIHFDSYRDIFRTPVLRNILDKLIYEDEYENIDENLTNCNVGSRKRRNIRDNLFVINAIANASKHNPKEATDLNVYDVIKCFDSLWLEECINDLYDAGLKNDKLVLLYNSNLSANIAIKTSSGTTERFNILKTTMQGTVWSGLMCTVTMDKLCQLILQDEHILYKYRDKVMVPPLEMVDDIISAVKCGSTAIALNTVINRFIESKKLKLGLKRCAKIHIGNKLSSDMCPQQLIHGQPMKSSEKEKYLGDYVTRYGNSKTTIRERKTRGNAIVSEMRALLRDIPLGSFRTQIGLVLRQAWFIIGCFFNSEVWSGYTDSDLSDLIVIDHQIMRLITNCQAKVPVEMLYLETAEMTIQSIISVRRLLYHHEILYRSDSELIKQIYCAMKEAPLKDDWVHLVLKDMSNISLNLTDSQIAQLSKQEYRKLVKTKVRKYCFNNLETIKSGHSKVKDILHCDLKKPQGYLLSTLFSNKQSALLFNLRSQCVNEFKSNFYISYCPLCSKSTHIHEDTQSHALVCNALTHSITNSQLQQLNSVSYNDLFGDTEAQYKITSVFEFIIEIRELLRTPSHQPAYPDTSTGPDGG